MKSRIIVIGGGASGIAAAIILGRKSNDNRITVIERKDRILKKLLQTGNGRCNFSNEDLDIENYFGNNLKFAESALRCFGSDAAKRFFRSLGVESRTEDGRIYPYSGQASSVVDMLRAELERLKIEVITEAEVKRITRNEAGFFVSCGKGEFVSDKLIYALGGSSALGSEALQNHKLVSELGHSVTKLRPGLVQLKANAPFLASLAGQRAEVELSAYSGNKHIKTLKGEILFTDYGISGIAVMSMSMLYAFQKLRLSINFVPDLSHELLYDRFDRLAQLEAEHFLSGLTGKRIGMAIIKNAGIKLTKKICELSETEANAIMRGLTATELEIIGDNGFKNSQVTIGGVKTDEICEKTMESKLVPGLYICGEALDVAGDCGGYNLHFAWASAYAAANSIGGQYE